MTPATGAAAPLSQLISRLLVEKSTAADKVETAAKDCLIALKKAALERELQQIKARLAQPGLSSNDMVKLQQRALDLRRDLDNITRLSVWKPLKSSASS